MRQFQKTLQWSVFTLLLAMGVILCYFCPGYKFSGVFLIAASSWIPFHRLLTIIPHRKWRRGLYMLEVVILSVFLAAMVITGITIVHSSRGTEHPEAEYLIVLGAGVNGDIPSRSLQERLDRAVAYLNSHPDAIAIVSGGQGDGENISEAQCMYQVLTNSGISSERIWTEPHATSTLENLTYSLDVIKAHTGTLPETVAIVSSEYHLHRAAMFARRLGIEAELVPAVTSALPLRLNYYLREIFAVWYYSFLGGSQHA